MTEQKALKRRVRARMARTGERYTTARAHLIPPDRGPVAPRAVPPPGMTSDESLRRSTGRGWAEWIGVLDGWGAEGKPHRDIARWLNRDQGVDGWWSQQITVGYEIAIGRRVVGHRHPQCPTPRRTGLFPVRRRGGPEARRRRYGVGGGGSKARVWLPGARLRPRASKAERTARFDWEDGASRVVFWFEQLGDAKSRVAMEHERLADKAATDAMKSYWRAALGRLKDLVEG